MHKFMELLTAEDAILASAILRTPLAHRAPDFIIAPDGKPYLYRWHVVPRNKRANVYMHIQIASDPERPLHDHPWDNTSVILSGGYDETWNPAPWLMEHKPVTRVLRKGDTVFRRAAEAHRLILPKNIPYTLTLFTTGPAVRAWGFWFADGWRDADEVTEMDNTGQSVMKEDLRHV